VDDTGELAEADVVHNRSRDLTDQLARVARHNCGPQSHSYRVCAVCIRGCLKSPERSNIRLNA
jgi:hypothetical protein